MAASRSSRTSWLLIVIAFAFAWPLSSGTVENLGTPDGEGNLTQAWSGGLLKARRPSCFGLLQRGERRFDTAHLGRVDQALHGRLEARMARAREDVLPAIGLEELPRQQLGLVGRNRA